MTIGYNLDISKTGTKNELKILFRWKGSVWQATLGQLGIWIAFYMAISLTYRFLMDAQTQRYFEALAIYLDTGLNATIPLTFMLGFFVSFVVARWTSILRGLGWIDDFAMIIATYIRENDEETRMIKRNMIRYMVLNQALVLRDISLQVRKRFPTLETLVAAGLLTEPELMKIRSIDDVYSQYWAPIQWVNGFLYKAHADGKIISEKVLDTMIKEVQHFREGLTTLLRYDWVPIPLVYPQVIFLAVRLYFAICLISRQFIIPNHTNHKDRVDLWIPITTILQFIVYMGWMEVAQALINPLGDDDDDLECNYVIDKNLITGLTLVEEGAKELPKLVKDDFWDSPHIVPLYSHNSAEKRALHPLEGSAAKVNLVEKVDSIKMCPNRTYIPDMTNEELFTATKIVSVKEHNRIEKARKRGTKTDPDKALKRIKLLTPCMKRKPQTVSAPASARVSLIDDDIKTTLHNLENGNNML